MSLDLTQYSSAKTKTKKVGTGRGLQNFDLKYRDTNFTVSNKVWDEIGLDTLALKILIHPTTKQVVLVPVDNEQGDLYKRTKQTKDKKFRSFRSPIIEAALVEQGLISKTEKVKGVDSTNQFLGLTKEIANDGTVVYVVGTDKVESSSTVAPVADDLQAATGSGLPEEQTPTPVDQVPSSEDLVADTEVAEDEDFDEKF